MLKHSMLLSIGAACIVLVSCCMFIASRSYTPLNNSQPSDEKSILVIIPSYNNAQWCIKNLESIFMQQYNHYRIVLIIDAATDNTEALVQDYIKHHDPQKRITMIINKKNQGAMANIYHAIHTYAHDDDIIVTIDGDDWLSHDRVFETLNKAYADHNVWMTYGNYTHWPEQSFPSTCGNIPQVVIDNHAYRRYQWKASHLRTFYAWLFKKIAREDLCDNNGFYRVTWDQAFMFPMLEMSGGRWRFIQEILYVYNVQNPLNDFKVRLKEQLATEKEIRSKKPYAPLAPIIGGKQ